MTNLIDVMQAADSGTALDQLPAADEARKLRLSAGLTLQQTATAVGISTRSLLAYESGDVGRITRPAARLRYGRVLRYLNDAAKRAA